jgi:regulatory protein
MRPRTRAPARPAELVPIPSGLVTGIDPSPRKPGRFELSIDGSTVATLSIDDIERLGLQTGTPVNDMLGGRIADAAATTHVYDRALLMLAARARSRQELERLLVKKGEDPAAVTRAAERLAEVGFLDDAAFARQFARAKAVGAKLSRRRIQQELGRRGVGRTMADRAVETVFEEEGIDESESIERVAEKKLRTMGTLDDATRRRRLYGFLARRGYPSDAISKVMKGLEQ